MSRDPESPRSAYGSRVPVIHNTCRFGNRMAGAEWIRHRDRRKVCGEISLGYHNARLATLRGV